MYGLMKRYRMILLGWGVMVSIVPVSEAEIIAPKLPPGVIASNFRMTVFAEGLNYPTSMQKLADGSILVGTSDPVSGGNMFNSTGTLRRLVDADGDGKADSPQGSVVYSGLPGVVTSVRQAGGLLYVTSARSGKEQISVLRAGATPSDPYSLVGDIRLEFPPGWEHTSYALAVRDTPGSPGDHDVFFNVGAQNNATPSVGVVPVSGLISGAVNPDSLYKVTVHDGGGAPSFRNLTQVASGLRNATGMAFQPGTGDLYFQDNGIDGLTDPANTPLSVDELNRIQSAAIGGPAQDFGFPNNYITYRTGVEVGGGGVQPLATFQPIPNPLTGSESTGANEIAFSPDAFTKAGLAPGIFIGFHGHFNEGGLQNDKNPVIFYDLTTKTYFDFISNDEPDVGHIDSLLATSDSLFLADLSSTGVLFNLDGLGQGVIYQLTAVGVVPEPSSLLLSALGLSCACLAFAAFPSRNGGREGPRKDRRPHSICSPEPWTTSAERR